MVPKRTLIITGPMAQDSDDASGHFVLNGGNGGPEASGSLLAVCPCR